MFRTFRKFQVFFGKGLSERTIFSLYIVTADYMSIVYAAFQQFYLVVLCCAEFGLYLFHIGIVGDGSETGEV